MVTQYLAPKKKKIIFSVVLFLLIVLSILFGAVRLQQNKNQRYNYAFAEKGAIRETVSVTGRIKPAAEIGLAFERAGKVAKILANTGDRVKPGQALIRLKSDEITAQLKQAKAQLSFQRAKLQGLENGASPAKREVAQAKVNSAKEDLAGAQQQLARIQEKNKTSLNNVCHTSLENALASLNIARTSLLTLTDLQYSYFNDSSQQSINLADAKEEAILKLFGRSNCGRCIDDIVASLNGGLESQLKALRPNNNLRGELINPLLSALSAGLKSVKAALDAVQVSKLTSSESTSLDTAKASIYTEIAKTATNQQSINLQEKTNENSLTTYRNKVDAAEKALALAQKELILTEAPPTQDEINAQEAQIQEAEAQIAYYQAQLAKMTLRSPLDAIVTAVDIKEGEMASPQQIVVKLISHKKFQIEADIAETDIANVKIGQQAEVTLDAYGDEVKFMARVIKIDPAEKMIEGIATYKTTFQFIKVKKPVKPGMTANIDILVKQKKNVLIIPQRAVIRKENGEFVRILDKDNQIKQAKIITGIRGDEGNIEVIKGLQEGDRVITFIKTP